GKPRPAQCDQPERWQPAIPEPGGSTRTGYRQSTSAQHSGSAVARRSAAHFESALRAICNLKVHKGPAASPFLENAWVMWRCGNVTRCVRHNPMRVSTLWCKSHIANRLAM